MCGIYYESLSLKLGPETNKPADGSEPIVREEGAE